MSNTITRLEYLRDTAFRYAWKHLLTRFPMDECFDTGFFISKILKSVGIIDYGMTSHDLYRWFANKQVKVPYTGVISFYWDINFKEVIHTEFCISDTLSIGLDKGDSQIRLCDFSRYERIAALSDPFLELDAITKQDSNDSIH
jgi:hypothetical protein